MKRTSTFLILPGVAFALILADKRREADRLMAEEKRRADTRYS